MSSSSGASPLPDDLCVVFVVELDKGPYGLGMGLIDGLVSRLLTIYKQAFSHISKVYMDFWYKKNFCLYVSQDICPLFFSLRTNVYTFSELKYSLLCKPVEDKCLKDSQRGWSHPALPAAHSSECPRHLHPHSDP